MSKALKEMMFSHYDSLLGGRESLLFVDNSKITAEDTRALRGRLREQNVLMLVVANRVFDKVLEKRGVQGFRGVASGPVAVLYSEDEGGAQRAAKIVSEWTRKKKCAEIVGGMMEGSISGADEAKTWKDLPTREEQLSIVAGQILAMGGKLASQIKAMGGAIASQIEKRAEGEGNPPPAAG